MSANFEARGPSSLPDPREHWEDFLVNHRCAGWVTCRSVFEDDKFLYFYDRSDEEGTSYIDISDISLYVKLPSSTTELEEYL